MWETWVWSLGWEDPLEEEIATHSSMLAWRIPMDRGAWWATVHGVTESDATEWLSTAQWQFKGKYCTIEKTWALKPDRSGFRSRFCYFLVWLAQITYPLRFSFLTCTMERIIFTVQDFNKDCILKKTSLEGIHKFELLPLVAHTIIKNLLIDNNIGLLS